jgi:hypothetical protein
MVRRPDGTWRPDFTAKDPDAYPLPMITHLVVPTSGFSAERIAWLEKFFAFALGDGQTKYLPDGYVPLPADVLASAKASAATVIGQLRDALASQNTTTTTSTTTTQPASTTTADTVPADDGGGLLPGGGGDLGGGDPGGGSGVVDTGDGTPTGTGGTGTTAPDDGSGSGTGTEAVDAGGDAPLATKLVSVVTGNRAVPPLLVGVIAAIALLGGPLLQFLAGAGERGSLYDGLQRRFRRLRS